MSDTSLIFNLLAVDRITGVLGGVGGAFNKFALGAGVAIAAIGDKTIKMAADFQQGMTRLQTGAGESAKNIKMVGDGILAMAGQVGESTKDLSAGMYLIESAGFHGADGLNVLRDAAEGAKVGNADMATVADAVTTALNAYHLGADQAAAATNALIAAEGQGKTNLEALSASLSTVAPIAAVAHVSLNEVLAAMATMTGQGTDAASAATYLKQTIGQLSNPTGKAAQEMKSLGLDATQVSLNLGKNGLASTLLMLTDAIESKMGPAGTVLIQHLQKAAASSTDFQKVLASLPPAQQTYIGALANMVGGTKSMQAALELTGDNMKTFTDNTAIINEKVKAGGANIEGWALVQKNFNQRMAEAKGTVEALGIRIGSALLPAAQKVLNVTMDVVQWFTKHKTVATVLASAIGAVAAGFLAYKTYLLASTVATNVATAAQWLFNVAMDANPIGLIIIGIVALVAVFAYLWTHSAAFRNFWIGLWNDIWGFLKAVGGWFAGPFAGFFVAAWHDISAGALWLWHNVLDPVWQAISAGVAFVANIISSFAHLWYFIMQNTVGAVVLWLWHNVFDPAIHAIADSAMWLWHNVIQPVASGIGVAISAVGSAAMWLWHNAIEPALHGVADVALWLWHNVISPVFGWIGGAASVVAGAVKSAFGAVSGFISSAFSGAVGIVKGALNGVISVIDSAIGGANSIINTLNKVPGVSFPHLPTIPHLDVGGDVQRSGVAVIHQGERVVPAAQVKSLSGGSQGGAVTVRVAGAGDSALATFLHGLVRQGILQFVMEG
jgi:TP901 family phage tail tape measure protein